MRKPRVCVLMCCSVCVFGFVCVCVCVCRRPAWPCQWWSRMTASSACRRSVSYTRVHACSTYTHMRHVLHTHTCTTHIMRSVDCLVDEVAVSIPSSNLPCASVRPATYEHNTSNRPFLTYRSQISWHWGLPTYFSLSTNAVHFISVMSCIRQSEAIWHH